METVRVTVTLSQETANLLLMMSAMTRMSVAELLEKAADDYVHNHLAKTISDVEQKRKEETPVPKEAEPDQQPKADRMPFADLGLSVRAYNRLCFYFDSEEEALAYDGDPVATASGLRNLGVRSAHEIARAFKEHGYKVEGTVWEKYLTYEVKSVPKPVKPVYLADEEEFAKLHVRVRELNILRANFRNIEDVLALKKDPLAIRRLGDTAARRIAHALQKAGYIVHSTVWEKFLPD